MLESAFLPLHGIRIQLSHIRRNPDVAGRQVTGGADGVT
jgi:hypothetical protein